MVFVINNGMKLSAQPEADNINIAANTTSNISLNIPGSSIPKSPNFHSGLDLVANNRHIDSFKFDYPTEENNQIFTNIMSNNQKEAPMPTTSDIPSTQQQQTIFSFSKVRLKLSSSIFWSLMTESLL